MEETGIMDFSLILEEYDILEGEVTSGINHGCYFVGI